MDFLKDVGRGFGRDWRGIILRREYKDLTDFIERSKTRIGLLFPDAKFRSSADSLDWTFATGEKLVFATAKRSEDIRRYLGQEWPWQGYDELCNWSSPDLYLDIMSCARSPNPDVSLRIRATTNPWGPGAWWVKERFIDSIAEGKILKESRTIDLGAGPETHIITRAHLRVDFQDNDVLRSADPSYLHRLSPSDRAKKAAWVEGRWDLSVGGFLSGLWSPDIHVLPWFKIPSRWKIDRAHDWGASQPHCTLWFAESNGEAVEIEPSVWYRFPKGTLFIIAEIYGWNGTPNTGRRDTDAVIAEDIREEDRKISAAHGGARVRSGPADSQIFAVPQGKAIIDTYRRCGVDFVQADKSSGSRVTGAKVVLDRLTASLPFEEGRPMEEPGLFVFSTCTQVIRTLPKLQRDEVQPDDVDTAGEDHAYDALRYRLTTSRRTIVQGRF